MLRGDWTRCVYDESRPWGRWLKTFWTLPGRADGRLEGRAGTRQGPSSLSADFTLRAAGRRWRARRTGKRQNAPTPIGGTGSPAVCPGCRSTPLSHLWLGTSWAQDGHQSHQHLRQEDGVGRVPAAPVQLTGGRTFHSSPSGLPLPRLASRTGDAGIPAVREAGK